MIGGLFAWFVFAQRDADFHVIGVKTPRVRANYAVLEMQVDVADFHDCKTLRDALSRLNEKLAPRPNEPGQKWSDPVFLDVEEFGNDPKRKNLGDAPIQFSRDSQRVTTKQFLRMALRQAGVPDAHFIVGRYCIEATTLNRVQEERARYLDTVSLFDRMQNAWKEMTGQVEDDSIWLDLSMSEIK